MFCNYPLVYIKQTYLCKSSSINFLSLFQREHAYYNSEQNPSLSAEYILIFCHTLNVFIVNISYLIKMSIIYHKLRDINNNLERWSLTKRYNEGNSKQLYLLSKVNNDLQAAGMVLTFCPLLVLCKIIMLQTEGEWIIIMLS